MLQRSSYKKYSFLICKEPVEDPWSYLQRTGTLGGKTSCQNSQDGHKNNVQQPCLCVFTAEFEQALPDGLLCELFLHGLIHGCLCEKADG